MCGRRQSLQGQVQYLKVGDNILLTHYNIPNSSFRKISTTHNQLNPLASLTKSAPFRAKPARNTNIWIMIVTSSFKYNRYVHHLICLRSRV